MATLSTVGLHFPEATPNGLFGVGHTQNAWFVVNKITGQAKRIGQVGGRVNYFDRALEEADQRNKEYEVMPSDEYCSADQLDAKHNLDGDGEHPVHTRWDWIQAVAQRSTISGYWAWVEQMIWNEED